MQKYSIYLAGEFVESDDELIVSSPFQNKPFAKTYNASYDQLNLAIEKALRLRDELRKIPSHKRYEILLFISNEIKSNLKHLAEVLCTESAKPIKYATAEVERAAQTFLIAAEEAKRLPREYIDLEWSKAGEKKEGLVKYFPAGIVAGISPFNFPLNLAVHKIAPAIAGGCPIILKPASATPLSTLELAKIIDKTDLPKGAVSILPMTRETGNHLVTDDRIKILSFTGSTEVGWQMKKDAGKKKVILELGGNAAVIITESADIEDALKKCLISGFAYSGQICIHAQRIFVHESLFDEFVKRYRLLVEKLKYADPLDSSCDVSVMIDQKNADRVEEWVQQAIDGGAMLISGGKKEGSFYHPTILTGTGAEMKVVCEEVFGPVVVIEKYVTYEAALKMVNDSKFGLQAGVFTNDIKQMDQAFDQLDVGGVIINDVPTLRLDHMPYGGVKESGSGREGVKYAIMDMMEPRVLVKPFF